MTLPTNPSEKDNNVVVTASEWSKAGPVALVTLAYIDGNAPYPIGAQMLVASDGRFTGQITGGCAERAIADHAVAAIKAGQNSMHRYGLNSPYFDIQLPCGSGIDVYFDVSLGRYDFASFAQKLSSRETQRYSVHTQIGEFTKVYTPQPLLIIVGQGPIVVELAKLSQLIGFDTLIVAQNDATQALCNDQSLMATLMKRDEYKQFPKDEFTGIVSLFHEHDLEVPLFSHTLPNRHFYFGALGSRRTHAARLDALRAVGLDENDLDRIYGPVGVDIMVNTPSQIAVTIVAQAIDEHNKMLKRKFPCSLVTESAVRSIEPNITQSQA